MTEISKIKEKIQKLERVKKTLKEEYIGIDKVIDQVIQCISPWYLTPELLERPVVVSLWGMTGVGKSSMVKSLLRELDLEEKAYTFDCGEKEGSSSESLTYKLSELILGENYYDESSSAVAGNDSIFILDEFQSARTIDEKGCEINKPNFRAAWSLIDSGKIDINETRYDITQFKCYCEDLESFVEMHPGESIKDGYFVNSKLIKDTLGMIYYDLKEYSEEEEPLIKDRKSINKYHCIPSKVKKVITNTYNKIKKGLGYEKIKKLESLETVEELSIFLKSLKKDVCSPKVIDCSGSLVFILGNLDEAYQGLHSDVSPEASADLYNSITKEIGIPEIKEALQDRFRNEQISRLGNNLITYPSLSEESFRKIIRINIDKVISRFEDLLKFKIEVSKSFEDLIYSEGVYPSHGVRPLLSTINNLFTTRLPHIFLNKPEDKVITKAVLKTKTKNLDVDSIKIVVTYYNEDKKVGDYTYEENLNLGKLRNVGSNDRVLIQAVHEASHAVIYTYLTGKYPASIIANSSMGGGVMYESFVKPTQISSREEVDQGIMVSMAGYYGEQLFWKVSKCLMGSSSDIKSSWEALSHAVYNCGYLDPIRYTQQETNSFPIGIGDNLKDSEEVQGKMIQIFNRLSEDTKKILSREKELIREMGIYLSKNRTMSESTFKNYIKKFSVTMTLDSIREKELEIKNYYKKSIKKED